MLVQSDRLTGAVARYIEYEALAYWASHALDLQSEPPAVVVRELNCRCPGYLDTRLKARAKKSSGGSQAWEYLMEWIADHFFHDAQTEGWFDAILVQVRSHPRAIRTIEFADYCSEIWDSEMPKPYPAFDDWRRNADSYVELPLN
jgi:hypothetical protein